MSIERELKAMTQMPATTIRIDSKLKEEANEVFDELGLSLSAAVNIFLKAVVREQGIPFEVRIGKNESAV